VASAGEVEYYHSKPESGQPIVEPSFEIGTSELWNKSAKQHIAIFGVVVVVVMIMILSLFIGSWIFRIWMQIISCF